MGIFGINDCIIIVLFFVLVVMFVYLLVKVLKEGKDEKQ